MRKALLLLVVLAGFLVSCEDKYQEADPQRMGFGYYPLEVGNYRIYNVTDIKFRHNVGDTARFQMRERIDTSFIDQTNKLAYKIVRSVRPDESSPWKDDSVMLVTKSSTMVMLTKDNTRYVKLVFPVKDGYTWLGDAYNSHLRKSYEPDSLNRSDYYLRKEPYTYEKVGEPLVMNGNAYSKTLTVIQGYPVETWIGLDDRKEVYAEGIGMVYRLFTRVVYCNETASRDCEYGVGYKLEGHERHEVLVSHGKL